MKETNCIICNSKFIKTGYSQKYCINCKDLVYKNYKKNYNREYAKSHKERHRLHSKKWEEKHPEYRKEYNKNNWKKYSNQNKKTNGHTKTKL